MLYGYEMSAAVVRTSANWALIHVTYQCCAYLLTIHHQQVIKCPAAPDLIMANLRKISLEQSWFMSAII
jgi:hypothetical protein